MFINPKEVVETLDVLPGMKAADFGAGAGGYSLPLAERVGDSGKVYAIDIRKEALELVRSKARSTHLNNIETIWADLEVPEGSHLKDSSLDLVIISNILFQVENKNALVKETSRLLKSGGRVAIIEWSEDKKSFGPPLADRINRRDAEELFAKAGFTFEKEFNAGEFHYGLIFRKA